MNFTLACASLDISFDRFFWMLCTVVPWFLAESPNERVDSARVKLLRESQHFARIFATNSPLDRFDNLRNSQRSQPTPYRRSLLPPLHSERHRGRRSR
jgi:hypothetical protein